MLFSSISGEICVVSGCSFAVTCFTNHGDLGTDDVSFGGQNVLFGMLVASSLAPWGTIERFRRTWEHKKGDLGVPGLDFCRFWGDFGAAIQAFLANFRTTIVFFGMCVCRSRF